MTKGVDVHQEDDEPVHDVMVLMLVLVLVLVLVLGTPEMVTPETLKPMNLLVEISIVGDHVVDGCLVDEHVVDGLVDDHEVVADRQGSLGKRSKILFLFVMARCVFMLAWFIVAVSAGRRCADYPPCPN
jgi:hypothetical protein